MYEIVNVKTAQCLANSKAVLVMFDYKAQRPMPIPDEVRGLLRKLGESLGSDRGQTPI